MTKSNHPELPLMAALAKLLSEAAVKHGTPIPQEVSAIETMIHDTDPSFDPHADWTAAAIREWEQELKRKLFL